MTSTSFPSLVNSLSVLFLLYLLIQLFLLSLGLVSLLRSSPYLLINLFSTPYLVSKSKSSVIAVVDTFAHSLGKAAGDGMDSP